jgi:hypothetical protein
MLRKLTGQPAEGEAAVAAPADADAAAPAAAANGTTAATHRDKKSNKRRD